MDILEVNKVILVIKNSDGFNSRLDVDENIIRYPKERWIECIPTKVYTEKQVDRTEHKK